MKRAPFLILLAGLGILLSNAVIEPLANRFLPYTSGLGGEIRGILFFAGDFALPWATFIPLIVYAYGKIPFTRDRIVSFIAAHMGICLSFSVAKTVAHTFIYHADILETKDRIGDMLLSGISHHYRYDLVFFAATISLYQAVDYFKKLRQKELNEARLAESLATAQLHSLKMKLQPHFLFNALQSISVLVLERDVDAATGMLERLGNLLRVSMESDDSLLVPLKKELSVLDLYLGIEEIRFKDRLNVERTIEEDAREALVPNLILQPLVENSIKHGIAKRTGSGRIEINIGRVGGKLRVRVVNDGPDLEDDWEALSKRGVGLRTTMRRLELLFPEDFDFSVRNRPPNGVVTELVIPFIARASSPDKDVGK